MAYHAQTFLGFKPDDQGRGKIYSIDHDKLLIFGTWVHLGMKNNCQQKFPNFMHK